MEIKILSKNDSEMEIMIKGQGHTLLNALKSALLNEEGVKIATYDIEFPALSDPVLYIRTDKSIDPIEALKKASKVLADECDEFVSVFSDAAAKKA